MRFGSSFHCPEDSIVDLKFFLKVKKGTKVLKKGRQSQWFAVLFTTSLVAIDDSVYPR